VDCVDKSLKISTTIALFVVLFFCFNYIFASSYIYELIKSSDVSSIATNANPSFTFESQAQVLMEPETGNIIYANNAEEKMLPASVTKLMTLLLLMERIDSGALNYSDTITCSENASQMGGSQIWFEEGESLTVDEALKAICIVSANDVTVAVAEKIGGSEENFASMMNEKAKSLGMNNTHYMNSHGIDEEGHYTCAYDQAILARELISKHPNILKYTSIWTDTLRNGETELNSTNKLIRFYDGATGLKTGYTSLAMYNLVGTATRGNTTFISVIMKAPSSDVRLKETKMLLDYGFSNFETKKIASQNNDLDEIDVDKNINENLKTKISGDVYALCKKGEDSQYETNIIYDENIRAPLHEGDVVGKFQILNNGEIFDEKDIICINDVLKSNFLDYLIYFFNNYFQAQ
jgi:D-alanyl-D-alanine carboxypeptidase (penicillin-binding protein 5/6)